MRATHNVAAGLLQALEEGRDRVAVHEAKAGGSRLHAVLRRLRPSSDITCQALAGTIHGLANDLQRRGFLRGDRVLVHALGGRAFVASVAAVLMLGGVPILAEPRLGRRVYAKCVRKARPRWHLVHPLIVALNRIPYAPEVLARRFEIDLPTMPFVETIRVEVSPTTLRAHANSASHVEVAEVAASDDALIVFTGGTTAVPQGVRLSHGALETYLHNIGQVVDSMPPFERFLADTPQQVLYALRLGKTAVTVKGRKARRVQNVLRAILNGDVDAYFGSPWIWVEMLRQLESDGAQKRLPDSLRAVLLGGAPVTAPFLAGLQPWLAPETTVRCLYGMTEAGPICQASAAEKLAWREPGDLVGQPLPGVEVALTDVERYASEGGADVGEVTVRSGSLFTGYLDSPARGGALDTGDLGRMDDNGRLVLMGRKKDMIIRRGINLYPAALEAVIAGLENAGRRWVAHSALVGVWDAGAEDEQLVLAVEPEQGPLDVDAFRQAVWAALGSEARPDHIVVLEEMPTGGRLNKVDRSAVVELCTAQLKARRT